MTLEIIWIIFLNQKILLFSAKISLNYKKHHEYWYSLDEECVEIFEDEYLLGLTSSACVEQWCPIQSSFLFMYLSWIEDMADRLDNCDGICNSGTKFPFLTDVDDLGVVGFTEILLVSLLWDVIALGVVALDPLVESFDCALLCISTSSEAG